jgi:hypothetical protein
MGARVVAIVVVFAAVASVGRARAENDPACAQYQEPMAYNACLARHGPKANDLGTHPGVAQPYRAAQDRAGGGEAGRPAAAGHHWQRAQQNHGRVHMEFLVR